MKRLVLLFVFVLCMTHSYSQSRFSLGVSGGFTTSLGQNGGGRAINAKLLYNIAENVQLSITSGYLSWHSRFSGSFNAVPILVGVRMKFTEADVRPYGEIEGGLYSTRQREEFFPVPLLGMPVRGMTFPGPAYNQFPYSRNRTRSTEFGYGIGAGLLLALTDRLDLDLGAKINYLHDRRNVSGIPFGNSSNYFSSVSIGLQYQF